MIEQRIDELLGYLEVQQKGLKWRTRAIIGTKVKWYNEVDEWDVIASQVEE